MCAMRAPAISLIDFFLFCMYSLCIAGVVELVYALDSKSSLERGVGSSPTSGTTNRQLAIFVLENKAKLCVWDENDGAVYRSSTTCRESVPRLKVSGEKLLSRGRVLWHTESVRLESHLRYFKNHSVF